jgi:hypothetical protein
MYEDFFLRNFGARLARFAKSNRHGLFGARHFLAAARFQGVSALADDDTIWTLSIMLQTILYF